MSYMFRVKEYKFNSICKKKYMQYLYLQKIIKTRFKNLSNNIFSHQNYFLYNRYLGIEG